jgi:hypothetical protein
VEAAPRVERLDGAHERSVGERPWRSETVAEEGREHIGNDADADARRRRRKCAIPNAPSPPPGARKVT